MPDRRREGSICPGFMARCIFLKQCLLYFGEVTLPSLFGIIPWSAIWCGNVTQQRGTNNLEFISLFTPICLRSKTVLRISTVPMDVLQNQTGQVLVKLFFLFSPPPHMKKCKRKGCPSGRERGWTKQREWRLCLPGTDNKANHWPQDYTSFAKKTLRAKAI